VEPVIAGERFTLAFWFTQDASHSEDARLLARFAKQPGEGCSGCCCHCLESAYMQLHLVTASNLVLGTVCLRRGRHVVTFR
jgi:hypothetical protein